MNSDIKQYKECKTAKESFNFWQNNLYSNLLSGSLNRITITVKQISKFNDNICEPYSRGRGLCEKQGEHSWFNHASDYAY